MPVFTETSSSWRDLRILPSFAPPLPRLTSQLAKGSADEAERYEVVVIGVSRITRRMAGIQLMQQHSRLDQLACFSQPYLPVMDFLTNL